MSLRIKALSAALGVAIASLAFNAIGCSTVIVGKDVSKTGTIIVGHNEDNGAFSRRSTGCLQRRTPKAR